MKTGKGTVSGESGALLKKQFLKNELGSVCFRLTIVNFIESSASSTIRAIPLPPHLCIATRVSFDPT